VESITVKFHRSYAQLLAFLDKWTDQIQEQCAGDYQRKASFYLWARYTISIRTLYQICDPHYIPDVYVIGRSCLEYDASLKGVMADRALAERYLQYPDKAMAYYATVLEKLGVRSELARLEPRLRKVLGDDWRSSAKAGRQWCNTSQLIEQYGGSEERRLYAWWSHFAHGSAVSVEVLQQTTPTQERLDSIIAFVWPAYGLSTCDFLDFAWGPVVTPASQNCKNEFTYRVMAALA
jgi:hypothetical protein